MKIDHTEKALYGRPLSRRIQIILGAIAGDIIGSVFKGKANAIKQKTGWPLFRGEEICSNLEETRRRGTSVITEDTVQMLAICDAMLEMSAPRRYYSPPKSYNAYAEEAIRRHCRKSSATFSPRFYAWLYDDLSEPYGSRGNVAVVRAIPGAAYAPSEHRAQTIAMGAADLSHDHPDTVRAAMQVAYLLSTLIKVRQGPEGALEGFDWPYAADGALDDIRESYVYDGTVDAVPYAIRAAIEGPDFEGVVRNCVALGGDSPTLCAIAGAFAALLYGLPQEIADQAWQHMPQPEWRDILLRFSLLCDNLHDKDELEEEEEEEEIPSLDIEPQLLGGDIMAPPTPEDERRARIRGCLLGLFCGDALGAPLEFKTKRELKELYPKGVTRMVDGWNATAGHKAGAITATSEMPIALLATLHEKYCDIRPETLHKGYLKWLKTNPPDAPKAVREAILNGKIDIALQDNTALLRVAAMVAFNASKDSEVYDGAIEMDASQTHAEPVCLAACKVFAQSLMQAIKGRSPFRIYAEAVRKAAELHDETLLCWLGDIDDEPESRYEQNSLEHAFVSAYYWLLHAKDFRRAMLRVANNLGSPSATGAITGALLGAYFSTDSIPWKWQDAVLYASQRTQTYSPATALEWIDTPDNDE